MGGRKRGKALMGKHKRDTLYLGSLGTERHPNFAIRNYEKDQGSVRGGVWSVGTEDNVFD